MSSPSDKEVRFDDDDSAYETASDSDTDRHRRRSRPHHSKPQQTPQVPYVKSARLMVRDGEPYTIGVNGQWFHFDSLHIIDRHHDRTGKGIEYKDLMRRLQPGSIGSSPRSSRDFVTPSRPNMSRQRSFSADSASRRPHQRAQRPSLPQNAAENAHGAKWREREAANNAARKTYENARVSQFNDDRKASENRESRIVSYPPALTPHTSLNLSSQQMQLYQPSQRSSAPHHAPRDYQPHDRAGPRDYHPHPRAQHPPTTLPSSSRYAPQQLPADAARPNPLTRRSSSYESRTAKRAPVSPANSRTRTRPRVSNPAPGLKHVRFAPLPSGDRPGARPRLPRTGTGPPPPNSYRN